MESADSNYFLNTSNMGMQGRQDRQCKYDRQGIHDRQGRQDRQCILGRQWRKCRHECRLGRQWRKCRKGRHADMTNRTYGRKALKPSYLGIVSPAATPATERTTQRPCLRYLKSNLNQQIPSVFRLFLPTFIYTPRHVLHVNVLSICVGQGQKTCMFSTHDHHIEGWPFVRKKNIWKQAQRRAAAGRSRHKSRGVI